MLSFPVTRGREWLRLSRRLSAAAPSGNRSDAAGAAHSSGTSEGTGGADGSRTAEAAGGPRPAAGTVGDGRVQWLTPAQVSCVWSVPLGSVYRLASERRWRRHSGSGRAYYHAADVEKTLRGSGG